MYDIIVIGAGPAGLSAVSELVKAGKEVLLIDKKPLNEQDQQILTYNTCIDRYKLNDCIDTRISSETWTLGDFEMNIEPAMRSTIDYKKFIDRTPKVDFECRSATLKDVLKTKTKDKLFISAEGADGRIAKEAGITKKDSDSHQTYGVCIKRKRCENGKNTDIAYHIEDVVYRGNIGNMRIVRGAELFRYPYRDYIAIGYGVYITNRFEGKQTEDICKKKVSEVIDDIGVEKQDIIREFRGIGRVDNAYSYLYSNGKYENKILFTGESVGLVEPLNYFGFEAGLHYGSLTGRFASDVTDGKRRIKDYNEYVKNNELFSYSIIRLVRKSVLHGIGIAGQTFFKTLLILAKRIYEEYGPETFYNMIDSKKIFWHNFPSHILISNSSLKSIRKDIKEIL